MERRDSHDYDLRAVAIGVSLLFAAVAILLILLVIKICYMKHRRVETIHQAPVPLAEPPGKNVIMEQQEIMNERVARGTITSASRRSYTPHSSICASKSGKSAKSVADSGRARGRPESVTGILVGLFGSPEWETSMAREWADHQWRQRRALRPIADTSQFRHTWHSQHGTATQAQSNGIMSSNGQSGGYNSRRPMSEQISHVSSFGEVGAGWSMDYRGVRPLSAVIEGHSMSALPTGIPDDVHSSSTASSSGFGNPVEGTFFASAQIHAQGPAVGEERGSFSMQSNESEAYSVSPYLDAPRITIDLPTPMSFQFETGEGPDLSDAQTYSSLNASAESSAASSWGQLPEFPSPPATPTSANVLSVNTVFVDPVVLTESIQPGSSDLRTSEDNWMKLMISNARVKIPEKSAIMHKPFTLHNSCFDFDFGSSNSSFADFGWPQLADTFPSQPLEVTVSSETYVTEEVEVGEHRRTYFLDHDAYEHNSFDNERSSEETGRRRQPFGLLPTNLLNRHHARVRTHVPFSLVAPPKAYFPGRTLYPGKENVPERSLPASKGSIHGTPLARMSNQGSSPSSSTKPSAPFQPSPLRKISSVNSLSSSVSSQSWMERILGIIDDGGTRSMTHSRKSSDLSDMTFERALRKAVALKENKINHESACDDFVKYWDHPYALASAQDMAMAEDASEFDSFNPQYCGERTNAIQASEIGK